MKSLKNYLVGSLLLFSVFSFSQAQVENGDQKLQVGFRFFGYDPGVMVSYDYGLTSWFSIGAGVDLFSEGDNNFFVYGRTNFHLGSLLGMDERFDLYPGIDVGATAGGFGFAARLGFRYFFSRGLGLFVEVGNHGAAGISINW